MEAMIAWIGMRPSAISWPPARRAAEANGAAHRFSQINTPAVLPGLHRRREVVDVFCRQQLAELRLDLLQRSEVVDVGELHRVDRPVLVLEQDQRVDHPDGASLYQCDQLRCHLAGEVARS